MEEKIKALSEFLGVEESEIKEGYRENIFETEDGEEYLVVTDDEADEEFYNSEENLIDELGLDAFSDWAKDYIIENCVDTEWFEDFRKEDYESYCEDIGMESSSSDEYENRPEEEMAEANCETKEDFIEYLCNDTDDVIDWFKWNFGKDYLTEVIKENNLLDIDAIIEYVKEQEGRGNELAGYDGIENEENGFYIYRLN